MAMVPAGQYGDSKQRDKRGRFWGRSFGTFVVLGLVVGAIATGCSSGTSTSSGTTSTTSGVAQACRAANTQFDTWLSADHEAGVADNNTTEAWLRYDNSSQTIPSPSSPQLTAAINDFNTNNQKAQAARQTANQDLAQYQATVKGCNPSTLSTACQQDFAQHQPLIETATRQNQANDAAVQSIIARQQAYRNGSLSAANAQTAPYNAAVAAFNVATNDFNNAINAHTTAANSCSGGQPTQTTVPPVTPPVPVPTTAAPAPTPAAPAPPSSVTTANYNRITNGMTLAQVEQILGQHTLQYDVPGYNETGYTWDGPNGSSIDVFITNGQVTHKASEGTLG